MCMKASSIADPPRGVGVEKGLEELRKVEKGLEEFFLRCATKAPLRVERRRESICSPLLLEGGARGGREKQGSTLSN